MIKECSECDERIEKVCGTDKETYRNECQALCHNVEVDYWGICNNTCGCDLEAYEPTCGMDGNWYKSECLLNCFGITKSENNLRCWGAYHRNLW